MNLRVLESLEAIAFQTWPYTSLKQIPGDLLACDNHPHSPFQSVHSRLSTVQMTYRVRYWLQIPPELLWPSRWLASAAAPTATATATAGGGVV